MQHPSKQLINAPEYYDTVYTHYEKQNPYYKFDYYFKKIKQYACEPSLLLDFGCAYGHFLLHLSQRLPELSLFGIEINPTGVTKARDRLNERAIISTTTSSLDPNMKFDVITAWDVLEHIETIDETLIEIQNKLKPHGLLFIVVPVYDGLLGPVVHYLDKDPTHIHKNSRWFWLDLLQKYFDLVTWEGIFRILVAKNIYIHVPSCLLKSTAPAILMVARNKLRY